MTIDDKTKKLQVERADTITLIKSLYDNIDKMVDDIALNNTNLQGDLSTYEGLHYLFFVYYNHMKTLTGYTVSLPAISLIEDYYTDWLNIQDTAMLPGGDGASGFYPDGGLSLNTSTPYLNDNGANYEYNQGFLTIIATAKTSAEAIIALRVSNLDTFPNAQRTTLLNSLMAVITGLPTLQTECNEVKTYIESTQSGGNPIYDNLPSMKNAIDTDELDAITTFIEVLDALIVEYNGYYDYFDGYPGSTDLSSDPTYSRTLFNTTLFSVVGRLATIQPIFQGRVETMNTALGSVGSGPRKWRKFWLLENIGKPKGSYTIKLMNEASIATNRSLLLEADDKLSSFVANPAHYFPTPKLTAISATADTVKLVWEGNPSANKYAIYRKAIVDVTANEEWLQAPESWVTETTAYFANNFTDVVKPIVPSVYRVKPLDSDEGISKLPRIDDFNSSSQQSPVLDLESTVSILSSEVLPSGLKLTLSESMPAYPNNYIAILSSPAVFARVLSFSDTYILVDLVDDPSYIGLNVSKVHGSIFV